MNEYSGRVTSHLEIATTPVLLGHWDPNTNALSQLAVQGFVLVHDIFCVGEVGRPSKLGYALILHSSLLFPWPTSTNVVWKLNRIKKAKKEENMEDHTNCILNLTDRCLLTEHKWDWSLISLNVLICSTVISLCVLQFISAQPENNCLNYTGNQKLENKSKFSFRRQ